MGIVPGRKRRRKEWDNLTRDQQISRVIMGLNRIAEKAVRKAQKGENTSGLPAVWLTVCALIPFINQAVFTFFHLEEMVKKPSDRKAKGTVEFEGDSPHRAVSGDGYDLVYHLPGAFRGRTLVGR